MATNTLPTESLEIAEPTALEHCGNAEPTPCESVTRPFVAGETRRPETSHCGNPSCAWCAWRTSDHLERRELIALFGHQAEPCWRCKTAEVVWPVTLCVECRRALQGEPDQPPRSWRGDHATTRIHRTLTPRRTAFVDWSTGRGVDHLGRRLELGPEPLPASFVNLEDVERVYLTGRPPDTGDGVRSWGAMLPDGWTGDDLHVKRPTAPVFKYRDGHGRRVELMRAAAWFDEGDYTPAEARSALELTRDLLGETFGAVNMLGSPAATGAELFRAQVPPGDGWPVLCDDLRELITGNLGQHRVQYTGELEADTIPRLIEMDGRLMYGALTWGMPAGEPVRGEGIGDWSRDAKQPGFYRCRWSAPEGWPHVGLLGAKSNTERGWRYPTEGVANGWVTGAELELALRHGWWVDVGEHIVWPKPREHRWATPPLDGWSRRLVRAREVTLPMRERAGADPRVVAMVRTALRHLLIDTIGMFVGRPHTTTHVVDLDEPGAAFPHDAVNRRPEGGGVYAYERHTPNLWRDQLAHPEWSAIVWGRARARILSGPAVAGVHTGALHVPRGDLLGIVGDALYLTADPGWPDDGNVGRLRVKAVHDGPLPAPASLRDIWNLR